MLKVFFRKEALFTYHAIWRESSEWTIGSYFWGCPSLMRQRYFTVKAAWSPACAVTMVTVDEHLGWVMARFGTCLLCLLSNGYYIFKTLPGFITIARRMRRKLPQMNLFQVGELHLQLIQIIQFRLKNTAHHSNHHQRQFMVKWVINFYSSWFKPSSVTSVDHSIHYQLYLYIVSSIFGSLSISVVKSIIHLTINYCSIVHHSIHHQLVLKSLLFCLLLVIQIIIHHCITFHHQIHYKRIFIVHL